MVKILNISIMRQQPDAEAIILAHASDVKE